MVEAGKGQGLSGPKSSFMKPYRWARLLAGAAILSLSSCAQSLPQTAAPQPVLPTTVRTLAPKSTAAPGDRYLDRMAIIDARKDFQQSPDPGYVLDAHSVIRFPSLGPTGVIIIGDSILTGWSGYFAHVFPNAFLDGRVGRQFSAIIPIWRTLQEAGMTHKVGYVVVELGTNGEVSPQDLQTFLRLVGDRQVLLVMPEMPRSWEHEVQDLYLQAAATHPNVHLVRWDLLSRNHPSYFWTDRVHPTWMGIQVMVHAIARDLEKVIANKNN
ncbi:acyltransferase [Acidithiobacillus sp. AMEEHan]|uniref:acyltransferase n=1 Tax=Acidithiobacillus sp. AMEEHan TaxID=2994951 RepID=UPI0027E5A4B0|nr:acyltransferase [Acidithiobacillus sp. AMEEHan]